MLMIYHFLDLETYDRERVYELFIENLKRRRAQKAAADAARRARGEQLRWNLLFLEERARRWYIMLNVLCPAVFWGGIRRFGLFLDHFWSYMALLVFLRMRKGG